MSVSVLMSIYNEPIEWIKQSIDSILNQTFSDFEFIIVNDNPGRIENELLLTGYENIDRRVIVVGNKVNVGLTKSLNKALNIATGDFIVRMDADDISLPDRIEKQVDFMLTNSQVVACGSYIQYFGDKDQKKRDYITKQNHVNSFLLIGSPLAHPSVIIRGSVIRENSIQYDEGLRYSQDYKFWLELSRYGQLANIPEVLLKYRISSQQISSAKIIEQHNIGVNIRKQVIEELFKNKSLNEFTLRFSETRIFKKLEFRTVLAEIYEGKNYDTLNRIEKMYLIYIFLISRPKNIGLSLLFSNELWFLRYNLKFFTAVIFNNMICERYKKLL